MKPFAFLFFFLLTTFFSFSQNEDMKFSHYVLPQFTKGEVLMKDGTKNMASLNYNALSEEMIFEEKGQKFAIVDEQLESIDTVTINQRKFIRMDGKFLELLSASNPNLYVEYKCRIKYPGKVNGPGGRTSQTSSTETYEPTDFRQIIFEVQLPTGYATTPYRHYWLKKDGDMKKIKSLKQLVKLYPAKKEGYKSFKKEHGTEFNDASSILKLITYFESD